MRVSLKLSPVTSAVFRNMEHLIVNSKCSGQILVRERENAGFLDGI
jgi:hypothetical protein